MSQPRPATPADSEATYRRVVDALQKWKIDPGAGFTAERQLASYLDCALADDGVGRARHEVGVTTSGAADVAVDGTVAVLLFREFGPGVIAGFPGVVADVATSYDYLVVLGYDLPDRDLDRWRMGKARYTASRADLEDVSYLAYAQGETTPSPGWPSVLWHYAEPLIALLAILIGVEIAVLLQLQADGLMLLGPAATLATALVLMATLVLVYERTDI